MFYMLHVKKHNMSSAENAKTKTVCTSNRMFNIIMENYNALSKVISYNQLILLSV